MSTRALVTPVDLTKAIRFIAPDDGNADDRTVMAVDLPAAVAPGQAITLDIAWTAKIPRPFARTGVVGNYFFIAQWFPKIGVLDPTGTWNCHQFHVGTEFFSDYGSVRRPHDRAARLAARRDRPRARAHRQCGRHDDAPVLPGGRPRLRVDDEPGFHRAARTFRASRTASGGHAADAAARARPSGVAAFREHARGASAITANGLARIRTATSRSSIRRGEATPTVWSIRRCSPLALRG